MKSVFSLSAAAIAIVVPAMAAQAATAAAEEPAITVTATRLPTLTSEVPATVTVIDAEQIADELATDIRDLVRFEPGVSVRRAPSRFSAAFSPTGRDGNADINIRGSGGE